MEYGREATPHTQRSTALSRRLPGSTFQQDACRRGVSPRVAKAGPVADGVRATGVCVCCWDLQGVQVPQPPEGSRLDLSDPVEAEIPGEREDMRLETSVPTAILFVAKDSVSEQ